MVQLPGVVSRVGDTSNDELHRETLSPRSRPSYCSRRQAAQIQWLVVCYRHRMWGEHHQTHTQRIPEVGSWSSRLACEQLSSHHLRLYVADPASRASEGNQFCFLLPMWITKYSMQISIVLSINNWYSGRSVSWVDSIGLAVLGRHYTGSSTI